MPSFVTPHNRVAMSVILLCALAGGGCLSKDHGHSHDHEEGPALTKGDALNPSGDFTLRDQDGQPFHLRDHRGKAVLLFFGYLSCPDICPATLSKLARVYALLGDQKDKVLTAFVTVDPDRDTQAKLKEYLSYFRVKAVGLTGTKDEIDAVVNAYKGIYERVETDSAMGYLFNHSDYVYVIDGQGQVQALFHPEEKAETIARAVQKAI